MAELEGSQRVNAYIMNPEDVAGGGAGIGAVNETAPASDTASSGLNGRLQRIAQRITSLIALIPASLGQKTMANSMAVTLASDQSGVTSKYPKGTPTHTRVQPTGDAVLLATNSSRISAIFQNVGTVDVWITTSGTASATNFHKLEVGKSFVDENTTSAWRCFVASGTGDIRVTEVA